MTASESQATQFSNYLKKTVLFGNEPTPELFAILSVYFVQGILGLARLAVSFFLKDDLGLSPAQMSALTGIAALPWMIKPVFGLLSDSLPLFGYRRRSYLVLSGFLGTFAWIGFALWVHDAWTATLTLLIISLSVAISDVIVDSIVVERARQESLGQAGSLQSLTWGISAFGGLITAYLSGWLLQKLDTQTVFLITAIFPLLVSAVAVLIAEKPVTSTPIDADTSLISTELKSQIRQVWQAITRKSILLPTLFVFIWQATPNADSAFFYFTTNELGFEPEFLGRVRLVTSVGGIIGIWIYQKYLKTVPFRKILGWTVLLSSVLGMTTLILVTHANRSIGIDDHWFSIGDNLILTLMGQIAFMPVLVLSARLCPPGIEATLFALLMSIWNLSGLLSHELGALLTHWLGVSEHNFDRLWLLVLITNLSSLIPLFFINWLPSSDPQKIEENAQNHPVFPPAEVYEHHSPGSSVEHNLYPNLAPEFVTIPRDRKQKQ